MKSYNNRGNKPLNTRYAHIFNPVKERNTFGMGSSSSGGGVFSFQSSSYNNCDNFHQ